MPHFPLQNLNGSEREAGAKDYGTLQLSLASMDNCPSANRPAKLIVFGGLPGVGKSSIARELAREIDAVYLRIDFIEQSLRDSGALTQSMNDAGYRVAYALADDNLRLGRTVIADCVNPLTITRNAWRDVARRVGVRILDIEVRCSDRAEHRRRVENRVADIPGLVLPTWDEVVAREYDPWDRNHIEVDTAQDAPGQILRSIQQVLNVQIEDLRRAQTVCDPNHTSK